MTVSQWTPMLGAIPGVDGTTFRAWAPKPARVELALEDVSGTRIVPMERDGEYWQVYVPGVGDGQRYRFRVDGEGSFPDPCSRAQPDGVHGASQVVDAGAFDWQHEAFIAPDVADLVIYEAHIGTLTPGGSFDDAITQLTRLKALGVNALEIMPVAAFPGRWNWGYDGVALFAPCEAYGGPGGLRRLVDAAHGHDIAVILDVVYNHFGPDGNYTGVYSDRYQTSRHATPWGGAINYDDEGAEHVRAFVVENLLHWVHEYHVDGFRLDATHAIFDDSPEHILAELSRRASESPRGGRPAFLIAETGENDVRYARAREEGGYGIDAVWADDFHHALRTLLRPENEGYFRSYEGSAGELARTIEQGFLYEGQHDPHAGGPRGTPARDVPWYHFCYCIQNHDQVGNRAFGDRLTASVARDDYLAASMLLLLLPQMPLLFQGQEFHASAPFLYFTDHNAELGRLVTEGRRREFADFSTFADAAIRERIPDPQSPATFDASRLDLREAEIGLGALCQDFYREVIALREAHPTLQRARRTRMPVRAQAQGRAVVISLGGPGERAVIAANFGGDDERLTVPSEGLRMALHSAEPRFGGNGIGPRLEDGAMWLPAHCAAFFSD